MEQLTRESTAPLPNQGAPAHPSPRITAIPARETVEGEGAPAGRCQAEPPGVSSGEHSTPWGRRHDNRDSGHPTAERRSAPSPSAPSTSSATRTCGRSPRSCGTRWSGGTPGTRSRRFEDEFARKHDIKYALATDSGSGALHSAVAALDLDPGDEIITTPVTDIGTVQGILLQKPDSRLRRLGRRHLQHRSGGHRAPDHRPHRARSWSSISSATRATWTRCWTSADGTICR